MEHLCQAKLIAVTMPLLSTGLSGPEELIAYCARVSSTNQNNPDYRGLLDYCKRNNHWSVFTMANAVIEIIGPRDITRQFTRHESLAVIDHGNGDYIATPDGMDKHAGGIQEFSQRYAITPDLVNRQLRRQDHSNRQNSIDEQNGEFGEAYEELDHYRSVVQGKYQWLISQGVAKECARVVLPEGMVMSKLYVNATLRSWLHYLDVRQGNGTQLEHKWLAGEIAKAVKQAFPTIC